MQIGGRLKYQAEYTYPKKVTHSNLDAADARSLALHLICEEFKQANIFARDSEIQVLAAKPETPRITRKALTVPAAAASAPPSRLCPQPPWPTTAQKIMYCLRAFPVIF